MATTLPRALTLRKCDSKGSGFNSTSTSYLLGRQDTIELFKKNRLCTIEKPLNCPDCFCYLSDVGWTPQANEDFINTICETQTDIYICLQTSESLCGISPTNPDCKNILMTELLKSCSKDPKNQQCTLLQCLLNYVGCNDKGINTEPSSENSVFATELKQILEYPDGNTTKFKYITLECSFTVNTNTILYLFKISSNRTNTKSNFYDCFKKVVNNAHTGGQTKKIKSKSLPIPSKKRVLVGKINRIVYVGKRGGEYIKMGGGFKLLQKN
jgi:hypothetical protein